MGDWVEAHFFLAAFMDLNTTRNYGAMGGAYSLSWDVVRYYAQEKLGLDSEGAQHFWEIIRDVDNRYVRMINQKNEPGKSTSDPDKSGRRSLRTKSRREGPTAR